MTEPPLPISPTHPRVVFPLHGIRTRAEWVGAFSQLAAENDWKSREASWNFGRFSLLKFLSPWGRKGQRKVVGRNLRS